MARAGIVEQSVMQETAASDAERTQRIARAWLAYDGNAPKVLAYSDGHDDNVRINWAETIILKGKSFLFGPTGLNFQVEKDTAGTTLERLEEEWPADVRNRALHQLAINGGVTGHAILRVKRNPTRVIVVDPATFDVEYDDEDIESVLRYTITWTDSQPATGEVRARRQRIEPVNNIWVVFDEESTSDGDDWHVIGEERWPYSWPPIFDCQHLPAPNEYWGKSALEPHVLDLIEALEGISGGMRKIVRHFGHPVPYVTGQSAKDIAQLDVALGEMLAFPNKDASVGQLELKADLTAAITLYRELRQALHEVTRIPEVATGKLESAGALSGVALSILYGPAVELGGDLRLTYGPMLAKLCAAILELAGVRDQVVTPMWPTIIPEDREADVTRDEAELRMRVISRQTVCERRGYDWEEENRRMKEEAEAAAQAALDAFNRGAGAGLGGTDEEEDVDADGNPIEPVEEEDPPKPKARIPVPPIVIRP